MNKIIENLPLDVSPLLSQNEFLLSSLSKIAVFESPGAKQGKEL